MNKSLIDIINKCKGKYQRYSKNDMFGFQQIVNLTLQDINHNMVIKESHIGKHIGKYNPFGIGDTVKAKIGKAIQKTQSNWQGYPDLNCDDPLYDGQQVR